MRSFVNYGAGTNSTAVLVEAVRRGLRVDAAVFADTGGEMPETYRYLWQFAEWLRKHDIPLVMTSARLAGQPITLEEHSLRLHRMPSVSYGRKSCSLRFKAEPVERWLKAQLAPGERCIRVIGFDADEPQRARLPEGGPWVWSYPLIEWNMGREECAEVIMSAGLPLPGISSCFFCGSARPHEVAALDDEWIERGIAIEDAARPFSGSIRGLGKNFLWRDVLRSKRQQLALPIAPSGPDDPCGCWEGARDADLSFAAGYCGTWDAPVRQEFAEEWPVWHAPSSTKAEQVGMFA